jgi:protein-S-isoprenylcysteine O-methyltransferase Ste14
LTAQTTVLIVLSAFWAGLEAWLIIRDRRRGKGKTATDSKTRNYNFLAITLSPGVAAAANAMPGLNDLGVRSFPVFSVGVCVMALGLALRIWSVAVLGKYFRTTVELEDNQKVIQSGPYRVIRHPSYTGLLLTCLGYGIALQNMVSLVVVVAFPTMALLHRIRMEETTLAAGMGVAYVSYQKRTKKLIPGIW